MHSARLRLLYPTGRPAERPERLGRPTDVAAAPRRAEPNQRRSVLHRLASAMAGAEGQADGRSSSPLRTAARRGEAMCHSVRERRNMAKDCREWGDVHGLLCGERLAGTGRGEKGRGDRESRRQREGKERERGDKVRDMKQERDVEEQRKVIR